MLAPFSTFSRPPIPDFNQDFVNAPIWADALHRMHYMEHDGLAELQQQMHQQLGEQWRVLQQLSQWVQDASSQLCLVAMSLQMPANNTFPSFNSSAMSSSGSSATVHPDGQQTPPIAHQMRQFRQPVRFNPQVSPTSSRLAPCLSSQTIALRARADEAVAEAKAVAEAITENTARTEIKARTENTVEPGSPESNEPQPNKKRGAALSIRDIMKPAAEPVRQLETPAEPIPNMQGRQQPCTESSRQHVAAAETEHAVSGPPPAPPLPPQPQSARALSADIPTAPPLPSLADSSAARSPARRNAKHEQQHEQQHEKQHKQQQEHGHGHKHAKDKDTRVPPGKDAKIQAKHKYGTASSTCPACSSLQQRMAEDSPPEPGSGKSVLQLARMFDQNGLRR